MVKSTSTTGTTKKTWLKKGSWSPEEDKKLIAYINRYGIWNWAVTPKAAADHQENPSGDQIYNNQTIEENNGSSGSTYEELQNLWDLESFPMEGLYMVDDYGATYADPGFLVSSFSQWGFQENTDTAFASCYDVNDGLWDYLLMEANEETV
ncbi:hypothetical protein LWI29_020025 [Acer saccharum]|uniref:Myb-like domain-containing protein n=1 Tax=Acer saccharum TaxID=4024 RepID=A0AA39VXR0_ACESA|nr:hypothetical protein LWI29_020025 [Acer saccharum]